MTQVVVDMKGVRARQEIIDDFQNLMYLEGQMRGGTWAQTSYCGISMAKNWTDMGTYAEIIWEKRPKLLIETGTWAGGSALFYAHLFDQMGIGKVVTIDIGANNKWHPAHPRIAYIHSKSSTDPRTIKEVEEWIHHIEGEVMVILDSDHAEEHVLAELEAYGPMVTRGQFLVVEDTEVNGHPVYPTHGPGPWEAVEKWAPKHKEFREDKLKPQKYLWSAHRYFRRMGD